MRTLILFTKEPRPGRVKTRLAAALGHDRACAVYRALVADLALALDALPDTRVVWSIDGAPDALAALLGPGAVTELQPGGDLGTRLEAVIATAFGRAEGPVAVAGTDCPLLGPAAVDALFAAIEGGAGAALIPADDGGYIALALAAPTPEAFRGIPWSTKDVLAATQAALTGAGRPPVLLPPLFDIDTAADLARLGGLLTDDPYLAPHTARLLAWVGAQKASLRDASGTRVPLEPRPRRIVSLVPSVTECVCDFGAGANLVGRTDYCISPAERVGAIPSVGGPKTFDPDAVARLAPDLVLANREENDRDRVVALRALGLRVHVAFPRTLEDAARFLQDLGLLLGTEAAAARGSAALRRVAACPHPATVPGACLVWKDPFLAASTDTLTSALMAAAGVRNVVAPDQGGRRYPPVALGALAAAQVLWLPSEPYEFTAADARAVEAALPHCRALRVPGEWLTWYGCRMGEAVTRLRDALSLPGR